MIKIKNIEEDAGKKIYRREFDSLFQDKVMKFKTKFKSRLSMNEDKVGELWDKMTSLQK